LSKGLEAEFLVHRTRGKAWREVHVQTKWAGDMDLSGGFET